MEAVIVNSQHYQIMCSVEYKNKSVVKPEASHHRRRIYTEENIRTYISAKQTILVHVCRK